MSPGEALEFGGSRPIEQSALTGHSPGSPSGWSRGHEDMPVAEGPGRFESVPESRTVAPLWMDSTVSTQPRDPFACPREHRAPSPLPPFSTRSRVLEARPDSNIETWFLLVLVVAYALLVTYLSYLRSVNFYTANWDLGINQQLLWTAAHGRLLYETSDLSFYNAHSFLQVHSAYLAFALAPLYAAAATPLTLFGVQGAVFAASAVPVYLFARETISRRWLRFVPVVLYLASFGVIAGLLFDFHWEAFLPLELLTFFLLIRRERLLVSLIPLAIGTLTLEVFPVLAGGVLLLALYERAESLRWRWKAVATDPRMRILLAVALICVAAYATLRLFQYVVVPYVLGVPSSSGGSGGGVSGMFGWGANTVTLPHSAAYWLLLLAAFAFLPLLAPRYLILSSPWFVYSVFIAPWFSHYFGEAYALIPASTLVLASVAGIARLERSKRADSATARLLAVAVVPAIALVTAASFEGGSARILAYSAGWTFWVPIVLFFAVLSAVSIRLHRERRPVARRSELAPAPAIEHSVRPGRVLALIAALVITVLVLDAVMSPMNTVNQGATPVSGYQFGWGENPMAGEMGWFTSMIPSGAQVLASNHLFPYVANDPNAWAVPWFVINSSNPVPWFPFTPANLPQFVLADASEMPWMPPFLATALFNTSVYGLVSYAFLESFPGTVYLFEKGHLGTPEARVVVPPPTQYEFGATNLSLGPAGEVEPVSHSRFGEVIASQPVAASKTPETNIWSGPGISLLPGTYRVTFNLSGAADFGSNSSQPVLDLVMNWTAGVRGDVLWRTTITASQLPSWSWADYTATVDLAEPYPLVDLPGFLDLHGGRSGGWVDLNFIEVQSLST